jgi:hypothetical protein
MMEHLKEIPLVVSRKRSAHFLRVKGQCSHQKLFRLLMLFVFFSLHVPVTDGVGFA